jgi:hypothetical protein
MLSPCLAQWLASIIAHVISNRLQIVPGLHQLGDKTDKAQNAATRCSRPTRTESMAFF